MAFATEGRLAAAISEAGALGLIGGGHGDADWREREFDVVRDRPWAAAHNVVLAQTAGYPGRSSGP
jgi:hypothetical protein